MEININLVSDWACYLRDRLDALGGKLAKNPASPADIGKAFFNAALRRIPPKPRQSHAPTPSIQVPADENLENGYKKVIETSENGGDLLPFQSTGLLDHDGKDLMLFDWGIYHFHLSTEPHPTRPTFSARSGPLLYALVTENDFYQIGIRPHGDWSCVQLLDIVEENWPYIISHARIMMSGVNAVSTDKDIAMMRKNQVNCAVRLSSGNCYSFLNQGIALSGESFAANRAMVDSHAFLQRIERNILNAPQRIESILAGAGYANREIAAIRLSVDHKSVKIIEETSGTLLHEFSAQEQHILFGRSIYSRARNL